METYLIDVPMPSMGATVNELTVITLKAHPGDRIAKGQKLAELESDKSVFEFESPCDGVIEVIHAKEGDVKESGSAFIRLRTSDASLKHLEAKGPVPSAAAAAKPVAALVWTPRATKLAQEAGLEPTTLTGIEATGPGGRVSGDDVTRYLASKKT